MTEHSDKDWSGICFVVVSALIGGLGGYIGQPLLHENPDANEIIVTLFSILAGFLVAIMTLVGDTSLYGDVSWRAHESMRDTVLARLARQQWLFYAYLLTLGLLFVGTLVKKDWAQLKATIESLYLGFAIFAFLLSLRLPSLLMKLQLDRHDVMISEKRKTANHAREQAECLRDQ